MKTKLTRLKLQSLAICTTMIFTAAFVLAGIGFVNIKGKQNGIGDSLLAVQKQGELSYEASFMGRSAMFDLYNANSIAGFFHENSFLLPVEFVLAEQVRSATALYRKDPASVYNAMEIEETKAFFASIKANVSAFADGVQETVSTAVGSVQGVYEFICELLN